MRRRAPSFAGRVPASASTAAVKRRNTSVGTRHERLLRAALWSMGLRYRKDVRALPGRPDIVFASARVVVFCDGDFWHGRDWRSRRRKLARGWNAAYWVAKVAANRRRDACNTRRLSNDGWRVLRIWETDILRDVASCAQLVATAVLTRSSLRGLPPRPRS
ncbi:MAG: very short patch repair endonuclease [Acidobacteria bacterium]|nr:very short patch repair endonuclease [Acidobacteriota bacterium]